MARDEAFHFIYEENLELLRSAGAAVTFFSPMRDAELPAGTRGIILSGGFPEVFAEQLSANRSLIEAIRQAHGAFAGLRGMWRTDVFDRVDNRSQPC